MAKLTRVASNKTAGISAKLKTKISSLVDRDRDLPPLESIPESNLGFPVCNFEAFLQGCDASPLPNASIVQSSNVPLEHRRGIVLASVCTLSHLAFARTMIASVREHHSRDELPIYLLVIDWDGNETIHLPEATLLAGRDIAIDSFDYLLLKFTAFEMCCAAKPFLLRHIIGATIFKTILYIDSDISVFARLDHMLACLEDADLAVIPHTVSPLPNPERFYQYPSLGDLIAAGNYNAGMFGITVTNKNIELLACWSYLVSAPGAFLKSRGLQHEQNFFNWLVALADNVTVIKDTAYNVAYWNLHDRSLRYTGWDDEEPINAGWKVDGRPLVAFHFSGFSPQYPDRLSSYDNRHDLYFLPSVSKLIEFYLAQLRIKGQQTDSRPEYVYDRFASGLPITREIREIFKKHENNLRGDLSPWTSEGERHYAQKLFLPMPGTGSLLPVVLFEIYELRQDLKAVFPNSHTDPAPLLQWFGTYGKNEVPVLYEYFNCHRPAVPKLRGLGVIHRLRKQYPDLFADLAEPLGKDRTALINRFVNHGLEHVVRNSFESDSEYFVLSPLYLLWKFVEDYPKVQRKFPDLLFSDAQQFSRWLREHASRYGLSPLLADIFLMKAEARSLARIFCFLNRHWDIAIQWPKALIGEDSEALARCLLGLLQHDLEFDLDDVVMYLWVMRVKPSAGLPLTFELQVNACREPSPLQPEGQCQLLGSLISQAQFREALDDYRALFRKKKLSQLATFDRQHVSTEAKSRFKRGVNFFGYFKSPIGLGSLSHGLSKALRCNGVCVQENLLGNMAMAEDLVPEDFILTYDHSLQSNLFVSYPHIKGSVLRNYPERVIKNRENIVYLAWEQRDGYPIWEDEYSQFSQVWALSDFAASSFRRYMKRDDILTVPAVIDVDSFPTPASKSQVGLDPNQFTFLYVFDANSSIERKNPRAVIRAFTRAFSKDESVQLIIKITNARRKEHREKIRQLIDLAVRSRLNIRFLLVNWPKELVLQLISAVDCYVSLHRSEGFGYTCAESMAYGKPVIATNYSANTEFMDAGSAFLVDYDETEVSVGEGPFQRGSVWAEPCVDHAASHMRNVYSNRDHAQIIGNAARTKIRELLSLDRVGNIAATALDLRAD